LFKVTVEKVFFLLSKRFLGVLDSIAWLAFTMRGLRNLEFEKSTEFHVKFLGESKDLLGALVLSLINLANRGESKLPSPKKC